MLQMARKPFMVPPWDDQGRGVKRGFGSDFHHKINAASSFG
jgi:hypothetical protein